MLDTAEDLQEKLQYVHEYKEHIHNVTKDWAVQELLQTENIYDGQTPILFCQTDGMDQAKCSVPRAGHLVIRRGVDP